MMKKNWLLKSMFLFSVTSLMIGTALGAEKKLTVEEYLRSKISDPSYHTRSVASLLKEAQDVCTRGISSFGVTLFSATAGLNLIDGSTHANIVSKVAYDPTGQYVALGLSDDAAERRLLITFGGNLHFFDACEEEGPTLIDHNSNQGSVLYGGSTTDINAMAWSQLNDAGISYLAVATDATTKDVFVYPWEPTTTATEGINASIINPSATTIDAGTVTGLAWSPNRSFNNQANDPRYLAIVHDNAGTKTLTVWKLVSGMFDSTTYSTTIAGTPTEVPSVHWHPNGKFITIAYTTATTGAQVQTYAFDTDAISLSAPTLVATKKITADSATADQTNTVEFSPDGQYILAGITHAGIDQGWVSILGVNDTTGAFTTTATNHIMPVGVNAVTTTKWSPDGQFFVAGGTVSSGNADKMKLYTFAWNFLQTSISAVTPPEGTEQFSLNDGHSLKSVDWSPDGAYIALGGDMNAGTEGIDPVGIASSLQLTGEFDCASTASTAHFGSRLPGRVYRVSFNQEGVAGSIGANVGFTSGLLGNEKLDIWSANEGTELISPDGSPATLDNALTTSAVAWSPDSMYIASAFNRGGAADAPYFYVSSISVSDLTRTENVGFAQYGDNGDNISTLAWSRKNAAKESFLAVGGNNTTDKVKVYSFSNGVLNTNPASVLEPLASISIHDKVTSLAWSPNGKFLGVIYDVAANVYQIAIIPFNGSTFGTPKTSSNIPGSMVSSFSWHPNGKFFATSENRNEGAFLQVYEFDGVSFTRETSKNISDNSVTTLNANTTTIHSVAFNPDGNSILIGTGVSSANAGDAEVAVFGFSEANGLENPSNNMVISLDDTASTGHTNVYTAAWSPDGSYVTAAGGVGTSGTNIKLYIFTWDATSLLLEAVHPTTTEQFSDDDNDYIVTNQWSPDGKYIALGGIMTLGNTPADLTLGADSDVINAGSKLPLRVYNTTLKPGGLLSLTEDSADFNSITDFGNNDLFYGTKGGSLWFRRTKKGSDSFGNGLGTALDAWTKITGIPKGSITSIDNFAFVLRRNLDGKLYVLDKAGTVHRTTSTATKLRNVQAGSQFNFQDTTDSNQLGLPVFTKLGQAGNSVFAVTEDNVIYKYFDNAKQWRLVSYPSVDANGKLCVNNNLCFNIN